jgi:hypothetical protein
MLILSMPPSVNEARAAARGHGRGLLLAVLLALFGLAAGSVREAPAAPVEISQAPALKWGFKASWRTYATQPTVAGGATLAPDASASGYNLDWAFDSGTYDEETRTTVLQYQGTVRWKSHNAAVSGFSPPSGYEGPLDIDLLDLTLTDPRVTISRDTATITAQTTSRNPATWQMIDYGRIAIVDLVLDDVTPTVASGTTTWSGIPTTITEAAGPPFGEVYYPKGTRVDLLSLSYTGPGGAPDLADHFDPAGSVKLGLDGDNVEVLPNTTTVGSFNMLATDFARELLYYRVSSFVDGVTYWTYRVFDLEAMRDIDLNGAPLTLPANGTGIAQVTDPGSGKVYIAKNGLPLDNWVRYDADLNTLEHGVDPGPIPAVSTGAPLSWDPVGGRAFEVVRHVPDGVGTTDYNNHQWQLRTYARQSDGTWATESYNLPNGAPGLNSSIYQRLSGAVAEDGSFVILGGRQISQPAGAATPPATVHGAYRVVTHGDGTADTTPIPGTEVPNTAAAVFYAASAGADGFVALTSSRDAGKVQRIDVTPPGGQPIEAEAAVSLGYAGDLPVDGFAVDPEDSTVWVAGTKSRRLVGVRDGRLVADQVLPRRNPRGGPLLALGGGRLVMQSGDGVDGELENQAYGFQRLKQLGTTATIVTGPQERSVTLLAGHDAEEVSFTAAATATPDPTVQWQAKAPGSTRFANIGGETAATLTIAAKRGMDGTQYRAVYANPAGQVATDAAMLEVRYAPRVTLDLRDRTTVPGQDATFDVLADGNPEPQVTWQRRVAGYWQAIDPGDENFEVRDGQLVVPDTNLDQSGSLFRARLHSDVATAYTRAAKLTVALPAAQDLVGVHLDWTGSEELQGRTPNGAVNFFSAGVSDGSQATYASASAGVTVVQVAAGGAEQPASWATRDQHLSSGGKQLVRLVNGTGSVAPDGSATVFWGGSFSVNMYGGLVPFTIASPVLHVDPDGHGSLTGTLSGYASSQSNPIERTPIAPVAGVTIATFSDGRIDPADPSTITPDYSGVQVEIPAGQTQQARSGDGWGAWPQSFVDFQLQTGLGSYWYSSGGAADPQKTADPFVVSVTGKTVDDPNPELNPQPDPEPQPKQPLGAATITPLQTERSASRKRLARLAMLSCPSGGEACRVAAPKRTAARIAGKRYMLTVLAPKTIGSGKTAAIRVRLPQAAADRLEGRRTTIELEVTIAANGKKTTRTIEVTIKGEANARTERAVPAPLQT